jgi:hypothetical protein
MIGDFIMKRPWISLFSPRMTNNLNLLKIFPRIAAPSCSAAILMVAPKTPLPAGPLRYGSQQDDIRRRLTMDRRARGLL